MEKKLYYKANEVSEILGMDGIKEIFDNINQTTEKMLMIQLDNIIMQD